MKKEKKRRRRRRKKMHMKLKMKFRLKMKIKTGKKWGKKMKMNKKTMTKKKTRDKKKKKRMEPWTGSVSDLIFIATAHQDVWSVYLLAVLTSQEISNQISALARAHKGLSETETIITRLPRATRTYFMQM